MAGQEGFADMEGGCASLSSCKEGPVLTMINKRLRALKKKYNRILQIEESKAQGKQINKEQEGVLKGKLSVGVLIEEYEKLRTPLMMAVKEEIEKEIMEIRGKYDQKSTAGDEEHADVRVVEKEIMDTRVENEQTNDEGVVDVRAVVDNEAICDKSLHVEISSNVELEDDGLCGRDALQSGMVPFEREVNDLLHLIYFAQLFNVPPADASPSLVWTKIHERSSCISYDCVTEEDSSSPLEESDLNDLSLLGSLIISQPPNGTLSHRDALQHCVQHALLWLGNSDAPIKEGLAVTYSHLRERLSRILSSEYYTMIPELQTINQQAVAAAASETGQYSSQLLIHAALSGSGPSLYYANQERAPELFLQSREQYTVALPMRNIIPEMPDSRLVMNAAAAYVPESNVMDDVDQVDVEAAVTDSTSQQVEQQQDMQFSSSIEPLQSGGVQELQEQQQEFEITNLGADSMGYQGPRGGVAPGNDHGRARSYTNGRGGHGANRGGYGNGRGAQLHDQRGYYPRSQYGRGNGRAMRASGSSTFNGYANGQANNRGSGGAST
eukprot:c19162_g1_i1 orf=372-2030(-)